MDYSKAYDAITDQMLSWGFEKLDETSEGFLLRYKLIDGSFDCSEPDVQKKTPLVAGSFYGEVWVDATDWSVSQQGVSDALASIKAQLKNNGQFEKIECLF